MAEAFVAYKRLTSRVPVSEIIAYCEAFKIQDVEWMVEMVQQLDAYVMERQSATSENPPQPVKKGSKIKTTRNTVIDPYAK